MKYASMIRPNVEGGYFVMWSSEDYTKPRPIDQSHFTSESMRSSIFDPSQKNIVREVELRMDKADNLDEYDENSINRTFERMVTRNERKHYVRVFKMYEFYDENGDLLEPQPMHLINFRNGLFGHLTHAHLNDTVNHHNTNPAYFEMIKKSLNEKSNNTIDLVEIFAEIEDKPMRKQLVIQFKTKAIQPAK